MRIFSGLGGKLLLAFSLMALLTLGASLLGWFGLSHLRQLEQGVQQTLADQELARTLARLGGEIQSSSHLLASATSEGEREHQGRLLTLHRTGQADNHKMLFSLVVFEEWLRGQRPATAPSRAVPSRAAPSPATVSTAPP